MNVISRLPPTDQSGVPSFAVVIPLYNHEKYIAAALDSVLSQTYPASEIVLIDDGSSDNGFAVAAALLKDHHAAIFRRQANLGAHVAINRAIELSRAEHIAILNSDDVFCADKLARCKDIFLRSEDIDLVFGKVNIIDGDGLLVNSGALVDWLARAHAFFERTKHLPISLLHENFAVTTSNMVFKRSIWRENGGFQPLRYCHDLDFLMQTARRGRMIFDDGEHVSYRCHAKNTIREDVSKKRVEIAALLANTLHENSLGLSDRIDLHSFNTAIYRVLKDKALSELALMFCALRPVWRDRTEYYQITVNGPESAFYKSISDGSLSADELVEITYDSREGAEAIAGDLGVRQ